MDFILIKFFKFKLKGCLDNTYGRYCEYCLPGYLGDARQGTPYDCRCNLK